MLSLAKKIATPTISGKILRIEERTLPIERMLLMLLVNQDDAKPCGLRQQLAGQSVGEYVRAYNWWVDT